MPSRNFGGRRLRPSLSTECAYAAQCGKILAEITPWQWWDTHSWLSPFQFLRLSSGGTPNPVWSLSKVPRVTSACLSYRRRPRDDPGFVRALLLTLSEGEGQSSRASPKVTAALAAEGLPYRHFNFDTSTVGG